jgi:hypothetical protein
VFCCRHTAALTAAVLIAWVPLGAQTPPITLRYKAGQLDCARFFETGDSDILTQSGGRGPMQTAGRRAVWQFRGVRSGDGVALEGWLDSLVVWRRSAETTISPDTDGLLGGRYRGMLSSTGVYASQARPFIPEEVGEVAGMATALEDFFPPLPPRALAPGQSWSDSLGVTIRRLSDSALSGVRLYRFALEARREARSAAIAGDTLPLQLRQISQERGSFVWHPLLGLVRRDRRIMVETTVPPGRAVRQTVRSKIEQRITLLRDLTVSPQMAAGCRTNPS